MDLLWYRCLLLTTYPNAARENSLLLHLLVRHVTDRATRLCKFLWLTCRMLGLSEHLSRLRDESVRNGTTLRLRTLIHNFLLIININKD